MRLRTWLHQPWPSHWTDAVWPVAMVFLILALIVLLSGCSVLSPEERRQLLDLAREHAPELERKLETALASPVAEWVGVALASVIGNLAIVRVWRGGVHARKGEPPKES